MKILVCISDVPDTTAKIDFTTDNTSFERNGVQFVINPNDEFGLTRAMWFKEKEGAHVDVINIGEANTEPTLRKALAIGADRAIRINKLPVDGFEVAEEIAKVVQEESYDLVICGRESIDYNGGMVPGILAEILGFNFVNNCIGIESDGTNATAVKEIDGGKLTISVALPMVLGGQKGLVEESDLKIPNMRGIMQARSKPLDVKEPQGSADKTKSLSFEKPAPKGPVKLVSADQVEELVNLLHSEAKVI